MKLKILLILCVLLGSLTTAWAKEPKLITRYEKTAQRSPTELIIRYKSQEHFQKQAGHYSSMLSIYKQKVPHGLKIQSWAEEIRKDPAVAWVQPNHWRYALAVSVVPNDPYYLPDRNQRQYQQWYLPKINANFAWSIACGSDTLIVAVVDTGIDLNHPDIKNRLVPGITIVNQENYSATLDGMDDHGHGTHVAGIIGAGTDNNLGISGCSWYGKMMPVKVLNSNGEGLDSDIAEGIRWAATHGAHIINLSLGGATEDNQPPQVVQEAVDEAYARGCLVIAAAGNSGDDTVHFPAAMDHVLAVAATNPWDTRASYSTLGAFVDIAAPGGAGDDRFNRDTGILSTYWNENSDITDGMSGSEAGEYAVTAGTSMAAAVVSGAAAVLWSQQPTLLVDQIETMLKSSARDIGDSGNDQATGSGLLDLLAAMGNPPVERPVLTTYNYPNPFDPDKDRETRIVFLLDQPTAVAIKIYDSARDLVWEDRVAASETISGKNTWVWTGKNNKGIRVANGAYFYRLTTPDGRQSKIKIIAVLR
ncbi:S8 family serine peptidase [bacterium]|nr:S8 family serine peptidase [bacterium]